MVDPPSVAYVVEIAETECAVWYESREAMERMEPPRRSCSDADRDRPREAGGAAAGGGVGVCSGSGDSGVARTVSMDDKDGSWLPDPWLGWARMTVVL